MRAGPHSIIGENLVVRALRIWSPREYSRDVASPISIKLGVQRDGEVAWLATWDQRQQALGANVSTLITGQNALNYPLQSGDVLVAEWAQSPVAGVICEFQLTRTGAVEEKVIESRENVVAGREIARPLFSAHAQDDESVARLARQINESGVPDVSIPIYLWDTADAAPWVLDSYIEQNQRFAEQNIHGAFKSLATAQPLNSGASIAITKGTGKFVLVLNAGSVVEGEIKVTGTSVDRNTGATVANDVDIITVKGLTVDASTTDAQGNIVHDLENAYITSKWFTGAVTISTPDLTLTDVDVWHCSFEQLNDQPGVAINTLDFNGLTTNANAWVYLRLYTIEVVSGKCVIRSRAEASIPSGTAIADRYWRLRRGLLGVALDGTKDGFWVELFFGPTSQTYFQNVTIKVWGTVAP